MMIRPFLIGLIVVAVAILAGTAMHVSGSRATSSTIQGDADCSQHVDVRDAITVLGFASLPTEGASYCVFSDGNVNCDGAVDARDSLMLISYAANLHARAGEGCSAIGEIVGPGNTPAPTDTPPPIITSSQAPSETATATPVATGESGIRGIAQEGPMCPVERPDSPCPEQPVAGAPIRITASDGSETTVYAGDDGRLAVDEPPGQYVVEPMPVNDNTFPRPGQAQQVTVYAGEYTNVTLEYDSGIR